MSSGKEHPLIAVLSDIHGVLPALEAVLAEPDVRAADYVVLTGDLASGPLPAGTLDALTSLGDRARWIRGNADRELVAIRRHEPIEIPDEITPWAAAALRDDQVELLAALPVSATIESGRLGEITFCHATPRDDEEVVLVDTRLERWAEVFEGLAESVETVVCGHTHMPFIRLVNRRLVVNPGSVGMPYGQPGAHWALLGAGVQLRVTEFDLDRACAQIAAESAFAEAGSWAEYYLRATASDAAALGAFGPRDGRPG